jgi:ribonuclease HII
VKIGIDEVGRGCLAGPVTVCAVLMTKKFRMPKGLPELRDSKKMTPLQRKAWYKWIKENGSDAGIYYAISSVSSKVVDRVNIACAANLAAWRSYRKLFVAIKGESDIQIVLDGGLYLKNRVFQEKREDVIAKTVIRADRTFTEVKMAAVIAKVTRDTRMAGFGQKYPQYGFNINKGYGTRAHIEALRKNGHIEGFHRSTFISGIMKDRG